MSELATRRGGSSYGRGLHGDVVTSLGRQIVSGALQPGAVLNMERLEEEFSVSRSVLREAVRVLSAKGLVEARPKRGTIVCPSSRWNLLDPYVMVWKVNTGIPDEQYLQSWEQVRWIIEPQAVRMAATHRTEEDLVGMRLILNELADSMARDDIECYIAADLRFDSA